MTTLKNALTCTLVAAMLAGPFLPTATAAGRRGGFNRGRSSGGSFHLGGSSGRRGGFRPSTRRSTTPRIGRGISRGGSSLIQRGTSIIRKRTPITNRIGKKRTPITNRIINKRTPIGRRIGKGLERIRHNGKGLRGKLLPNRGLRNIGRKYVRKQHMGVFKKHKSQWSQWLSTKHRGRWGLGNQHHHRHHGRRFVWTWVLGTAFSYYNPYCGDSGFFGGGGGDCYDYSQPIAGDCVPTDDGVEEAADANSAFMSGDYDTALAEVNAAVKEMPNNSDLHQFRSLILFAMGRYQESAAAAHAALVNDNGWNWEILKGFYASTDTYTAQLRALEKFTDAKPKNAPGRFLLAYHYLMLGHARAAVKQLKVVVALEPRDQLSASILQAVAQQEKIALEPAQPQGNENPTPENGSTPDLTPPDAEPETPAQPAEPKSQTTTLVGSWKSQSADGQPPVMLVLKADGTFSWTVKAGKQQIAIAGKYALTGNQLKLNRKEGGSLDGKITIKSDNQFLFKLKWQGEDEPGVVFNRVGAGQPTPTAPAKPDASKTEEPKKEDAKPQAPKNDAPKKSAISLPGTWKSVDAKDEPPVTLVFKADGSFSWTVKADGEDVVIAGTYALTGDKLKLSPKDGEAFDGKVAVKDANQFTFTLTGDAAGEPGVVFKRQ